MRKLFSALIISAFSTLFFTACNKENSLQVINSDDENDIVNTDLPAYTGGAKLKKQVIYNPANGFAVTIYYDYNDKQKLDKVTVENANNEGTTVTDQLIYGADDKLAGLDISDNHGYTSGYKFVYDAQGRIVQKLTDPTRSTDPSAHSFAYDAQNRIIADTVFAENPYLLYSYQTYTYNDAGNMTHITNYKFTNGAWQETWGPSEFLYDDKVNPFYSLRDELMYVTMGVMAFGKNNQVNLNNGTTVYEYYLNGLPGKIVSNFGEAENAQTVYYLFYYE